MGRTSIGGGRRRAAHPSAHHRAWYPGIHMLGRMGAVAARDGKALFF